MKKAILFVAMLLVIGLGTKVYAGTSYVNYNTTVGKFNGSGYGADQTKVTSGANGYIKSTSVGGDYEVDVRELDDDGNAGEWTRNIKDGSEKSVSGHRYTTKGDRVRLEFSNDWNTPVDVQVTGKYKSNYFIAVS